MRVGNVVATVVITAVVRVLVVAWNLAIVPIIIRGLVDWSKVVWQFHKLVARLLVSNASFGANAAFTVISDMEVLLDLLAYKRPV